MAEDPTAGSRLGRCRTLEVVRIAGNRRSTPEDSCIGGNTRTSLAADHIADKVVPVPAEEVLAPEEEVQVPAVQEDPEALAAPEVLFDLTNEIPNS